jgi:hypothetical protein
MKERLKPWKSGRNYAANDSPRGGTNCLRSVRTVKDTNIFEDRFSANGGKWVMYLNCKKTIAFDTALFFTEELVKTAAELGVFAGAHQH